MAVERIEKEEAELTQSKQGKRLDQTNKDAAKEYPEEAEQMYKKAKSEIEAEN